MLMVNWRVDWEGDSRLGLETSCFPMESLKTTNAVTRTGTSSWQIVEVGVGGGGTHVFDDIVKRRIDEIPSYFRTLILHS
jgi:hypothetical protein